MSEALAYGLATALSAILAFVRAPLYTHWFDPAAYGDFALLTSAAGLLSSVVLSVFSNALYRYYDQERRAGSLSTLISTSVVGSGIGVTVVVLVAIIWIQWLGLQTSISAPWLILLTTLMTLQGLVFQVNRMEHQVAGFVAGKLLDPSWQLAAPLLLLALGFTGFQSLVISTSSAVGASVLVTGVVAWPVLRQARLLKVTWGSLKIAVSYGLPLVALAFSAWVIASSNRYVIHRFLGAEATGVFSMGHALASGPIAFLSSALIMTVGPVVWERVNRQGPEEALRLVRRTATLFLILAVPSALGLGLLADDIVASLFSASYEEAHTVVLPVALGAVLFGLYNFLAKPWELHEATKWVPLYVGTGAAINVVTNLWLVPRMGIAGAGWGSLMSYGTVAATMVVEAQRRFGVRLLPGWTDLAPLTVGCIVMGLGVTFLDRILHSSGVARLAALVMLGAGMYIGTFILLGSRLKSELLNTLATRIRSSLRYAVARLTSGKRAQLP